MSDSTKETQEHIARVQAVMKHFEIKMAERSRVHDASKLQEQEKIGFDEVTGALRDLTYGSPEYKAQLDRLKPILAHHYAVNSHHPEHYQKQVCIICFAEYPADYRDNCKQCGNGHMTKEPNISGMSLLDIVEMFCDWKAATERHANGSLEKSIVINKVRFKINDQLACILENTRRELNW